MLLKDKIEITINPSNFNHFKKYYEEISKGDKIFVDFKNLNKGSSGVLNLKCDDCGVEKNIKYKNYIKYGYKDGEWLCKVCKTKKNNLEKWGVMWTTQREDVKIKSKETCLNKYGKENPMQNSSIKEKAIKNRDFSKELKTRKKTIYEKWGVDNISKCEHIKEKLSKISYYSSEKCREKLKNYCDEKRKEKFNNYIKYKDGKIELYCDKCCKNFKITNNVYNHRLRDNLEICTICNPVGVQYSNSEKELIDFIKNIYNKEIILNNKKIIKPYELDVYLPDIKVAFEFNGIFWHSNKFKDKNYHEMKYEMCKKNGIFLFYIWEHKWKNEEYKEDIMKILNGTIEVKEEKEYIVEKGTFSDWNFKNEDFLVVEEYEPSFEEIQGNMIYNAGYKKIIFKNAVKR